MKRSGLRDFVVAISLCGALAGAGCGEDGPAGATGAGTSLPLPEPLLWQGPGIDPPRAPIIDRIPTLEDVSAWAYRARAGVPAPASSGLPYVGAGNGSVCCLLGTTRPLNTIHELFGPTYQKQDTYLAFPDISWLLKRDGSPLSFEEETIWRVRRSAVVLTQGVTPDIEMWTVTFAPFPQAWPGEPRPENQILFRLVYLRNLTSERMPNLEAGVRLPPNWGQVVDGTLVGISEDRQVRIMLLEPATQANLRSSDALFIHLALEAGQEARLAFALVTSSPAFPEGPALQTLAGQGPDEVEAELADTIQAWRSWYEQGAHLDTPDPRVTDLLEGLVITDKVQTTVSGGPVESSHYSLVWNRDTYGPMRLFTATGRTPEARGILDYHFIAVRHGHGLANAYPADLDPAAAPPAPTAEEWAAMPTFTRRLAAEGPSLLVLDYARYLKLRGSFEDFEPADLASRLDMLRACLYKQALSDDGLLPFSGDETFRPQMALSFGLGIEYPFEDKAWSFESGVLLVAAAEALARIEEAAAPILGTDPTEPAARARGLAERVRQTTVAHYWNAEEGYFEPFLLKAEGGAGPLHGHGEAPEPAPTSLSTKQQNTPAGAPYGDVDAVPFWVETDFPGVAPEAAADVLVSRLLSRHHVFFSPAAPLFQILLGSLIGEGIYTGMTPGLTLWNLASVFHPEAEGAFNSLDDHADPGGNYPEVVVHDETSPLMPIYDTSGLTGEMWARYRSWEGGINAEAALYFLSGFVADAGRGHIELAPRLPNRWPFYRLTGLRVGERTLDLAVERTSLTGMKITVDLRAGPPARVPLWLPGSRPKACLTPAGSPLTARLLSGPPVSARQGLPDSQLTARLRVPGPPLLLATLNGRALDTSNRMGLLWGGTATDLGEVALAAGRNVVTVEFAGTYSLRVSP